MVVSLDGGQRRWIRLTRPVALDSFHVERYCAVYSCMLPADVRGIRLCKRTCNKIDRFILIWPLLKLKKLSDSKSRPARWPWAVFILWEIISFLLISAHLDCCDYCELACCCAPSCWRGWSARRNFASCASNCRAPSSTPDNLSAKQTHCYDGGEHSGSPVLGRRYAGSSKHPAVFLPKWN